MKKIDLRYLICLLIVSISSIAFAQPKVTMDSYEYDGGEILPNTPVIHDFIIKNEGTEPLVINDIKTTCGCTAAIPSATQLISGATSIVSVTMTTSSNDGPLSKQVIIKTNDPEKPELKLAIKARVKNLLVFSPGDQFNFGEVPVNDKNKMTLYLTSVDGEDFEILETRSHHNMVSIEVDKKDENGYPITLTLDTSKISSGQRLSTNFDIKTTHSKQPDIQAGVIANILGPIEFSPNSIFFGIVEPGQKVTKEITATLSEFSNASELDIETIEIADKETIQGEILSKEKNGEIKMRFNFTAPDKAGYKNGVIHLKTNLDEQKIASIKYSGIVRKNDTE